MRRRERGGRRASAGRLGGAPWAPFPAGAGGSAAGPRRNRALPLVPVLHGGGGSSAARGEERGCAKSPKGDRGGGEPRPALAGRAEGAGGGPAWEHSSHGARGEFRDFRGTVFVPPLVAPASRCELPSRGKICLTYIVSSLYVRVALISVASGC